jgi:hypothetical protein
MYPVGFARHNGSFSIVLHKDCQFSRQLPGNKKRSFFLNVIDIMQSISPESVSKIVKTFERVDGISSFPDGPNSLDIIITIDEILKKGDACHV